jgi:hypothetical protein
VSARSTHIRCRGCDFEGVITYRGITLRYHLPTGDIITGHRDRGWCYNCENNRDIEQRFDAGDIDEKLQELRQTKPRGLFASLFGIGSQENERDQETIKNLQMALHLAKTRKSPPRCLTCGSDSTVPLEFGSNGLSTSFIHHCGERLYVLPADQNAPRISFRPLELDLDPEGNLLDSSDA